MVADSSILVQCIHSKLPSACDENTQARYCEHTCLPLIVHSLSLSPTFTHRLDIQPLLQILVIHFSANCVPRTHITSFVAWEQAIHFVCSSSRCKSQHVQTCLRAQHPSDMLRSFCEFNCCTSHMGPTFTSLPIEVLLTYIHNIHLP